MIRTILIFSKRVGLVGLMALAVVACGDGESASDTPTVVATTSIAGDLVSQIAGDAVTVEVLMPIGADPHDFQPSSAQAALLRSADLVVAWGLGLEEGLEDVLAEVEAEGIPVIELSALVDPLPYDHDAHEGDEGDEGEDDEHDGDAHGEGLDPHTWTDPVRMADAARAIGAALADVAPDGDWESGAERAATELLAAHERIEDLLAGIPEDRRKLVTNHDSLGYFAERYDFEVVGVAIPGGSTLAAPSSGQIADLVEAIRQAGVTVLFAETSSTDALLQAVAGEIEGVRVVEILTGSLAALGERGDTLVGMLESNAEIIADALAG